MIPQNELGVIVEFSKRATEAGIAILEIRPAFPDARIERDGQEYLVEFEYKSSNFIDHNHDIRHCDLIICWENDYKEVSLPVFELCKDDWVQAKFVTLSLIEKEVIYWKQKATQYRNELNRIERERRARQLPTYKPTTQQEAKADNIKRLNDLLNTSSGLSQGELANRLNVSRGTVRNYLAELAANGASQ